MIKEKTFCYQCRHKTVRALRKINYVEHQLFEYWCGATDKAMMCKTRNTKGTCKYWQELERDFPW